MVTFTPDQLTNSAAVVIRTNDATRPMVGVALNGSGLTGKLSVPATSTISAPVGTTATPNLVIKKTGKGFLGGDWASLSTGPYTVIGGPIALQPGATVGIPIYFQADRQREFSDGGLHHRHHCTEHQDHPGDIEGGREVS